MNERMSGPATAVKMTSGENWPATVWTRGELNRSGQEIWPGNGTGTDGVQAMDGTATAPRSEKTWPHPLLEPQVVEWDSQEWNRRSHKRQGCSRTRTR